MHDDSAHPRYLVTGASGFIGQALTTYLREQGCPVNTYSRRPGQPGANRTAAESGRGPDREFLGDIVDEGLLANAMSDCETVFHLAGIAHTAGVPHAQFQRSTVEGIRALVAAAKKASLRRIVYFSSSQVDVAGREPAMDSAYVRSKRRAELILQDAARDGLEVIVLRPAHVYGVGMKGNIGTMLDRIASHRLPPLPRLPGRLSMVAVEDLCVASLAAARVEPLPELPLALCDGHPYGINELEEAMYRALGREKPAWRCPRVVLYGAALAAEALSRIVPGSTRIGLATYRSLTLDQTVDGSPARQVLGFNPTRTFFDALPELIAHHSR